MNKTVADEVVAYDANRRFLPVVDIIYGLRKLLRLKRKKDFVPPQSHLNCTFIHEKFSEKTNYYVFKRRKIKC